MEIENGVKIFDEIGDEENHQKIINALKNVFDPDINYNIYDIGLIYEIHIKKENVHVVMTLTSVNCPAAQTLTENMVFEVEAIPDFKDWEISVEVVFEPAWTVENMTDEIKLRLGLL